ncbi:toast rack family protein [Bacillus massiliigorillae]|uniref:toast rack family protein n=1 Tax=Bacillus massiliigorillae TaxID=1243664 RepID=UPI0003A594A2|nr:toast rack family protein [Bacillus massiliigorillae]
MRKTLFIGLICGLLFIAAGCNNLVSGVSGDVQNEPILIKKDRAKELDVELNVGAGELNVSKGAKDWIEGSINYNKDKLKPIVKYDYSNDKGEVVIKQKNLKFPQIKNVKNEWNIELSKKIPMKLSVNTGASMAKLDLRDLKLKQLNIQAGVSQLEVDLGGEWKESFTTTIETGVGETTVILPSKVGVKITSQKGIGEINMENFISKGNGVYVNAAYDNADVILNVNMEMGVGSVTFKLDN